VRDRLTPQEREDEYRIGRSWAQWNAAVTKRDALALQYGFKSLQPDGESAWLYEQWKSFEKSFENDPENALWKADKAEFDTGRAGRVIDGIDYLLKDRRFMSTIGKSVTWQTIRDYRVELFRARQMYEAAESTEERQSIATQWDDFSRRPETLAGTTRDSLRAATFLDNSFWTDRSAQLAFRFRIYLR